MKIYVASDHTGFELKEKVKSFLQKDGHQVEDCGAYEYNKDDDYPDFVGKVSEKVSRDPEKSYGIIIGGSGEGETMVANKYKNVRCAIFYSPAFAVQTVDINGNTSTDPFEILKLSKRHNNANMLSIGIRFLKEEDILKAIKIWLETPFLNEERHVRRIEKIKQIENTM